MAALNTFRTDGEDFGEQILSKVVKAGRRTYFLDVRATRANDYFLTITESRKKTAPDGTVSYDRHKIFLYKEDFSKFLEGLEEVIGFIKREKPEFFDTWMSRIIINCAYDLLKKQKKYDATGKHSLTG